MEYTKYILKNNYKKLIMLLLVVFMIQIGIVSAVLVAYSGYVNSQITADIKEYEDVDYTHICNVSNCKYLWIKGKTFQRDGDVLKLSDKTLPLYYVKISDIYITNTYDFVLYNKPTDSFIMLNTSAIFNSILRFSAVATPLFMFVVIGFIIFSLKEEHERRVRELAGNEALLSNKSMIMITENIHHEMNTPLEVIDNKVHKIRDMIDSYLNSSLEGCANCREIDIKLKALREDFDLINQSSEQIYGVLDRMKGFKNLRYSNGNKSLYDIVQGAFKVIRISNNNFASSVDEKLKGYGIKSDNLKNADLLNIVINHIKNSLEANATKIYVLIDKEEGGFLYLRIIDNGNGVKKEFESKMFEPNFSTKTDKSIRGNGLYLNKSILKSSYGDVQLVQSSNKGTTFELKIPVKNKQ